MRLASVIVVLHFIVQALLQAILQASYHRRLQYLTMINVSVEAFVLQFSSMTSCSLNYITTQNADRLSHSRHKVSNKVSYYCSFMSTVEQGHMFECDVIDAKEDSCRSLPT